jgi:hypothetical protein
MEGNAKRETFSMYVVNVQCRRSALEELKGKGREDKT